jgi:hypothetical protein
MAKTICKKAASVPFWDGYAPWYKLWMEHKKYHDRIIHALQQWYLTAGECWI